MIDFEKHTLANGLRVILHRDDSTPMAAVSVAYDVGSRDERADKTGFAHLFEHLMFGGSENAPDFDEPMQIAGGDNNAFTNNDLTCFYESMPVENLETALWLEADRMASLKIDRKSLNVQRKVVVEEFKETTLNEPYGDAWHHISAMHYQKHPYRWPVIGLEPRHIEEATLTDVKDFYKKHYTPNNAIIVVTGNLEKAGNTEGVIRKVTKWFGDIPKGDVPSRNLPKEPQQKKTIRKIVEANVPVEALYLAFRSPDRFDKDYYATDLLTDILSSGSSSRFYRRLLKEKRLFSEIDCYLTGSIDPGIILIEGKNTEGVTLEAAEEAIWAELETLKHELVSETELQKLKNKIESQQAFGDAGALNKAMNLAYFELIGNANLINEEAEKYNVITVEDIQKAAQKMFRKENSSVLIYKPKK